MPFYMYGSSQIWKKLIFNYFVMIRVLSLVMIYHCALRRSWSDLKLLLKWSFKGLPSAQILKNPAEIRICQIIANYFSNFLKESFRLESRNLSNNNFEPFICWHYFNKNPLNWFKLRPQAINISLGDPSTLVPLFQYIRVLIWSSKKSRTCVLQCYQVTVVRALTSIFFLFFFVSYVILNLSDDVFEEKKIFFP
jgi:hypothetical protein